MIMIRILSLTTLLTLLLPSVQASVDRERIINADAEPGSWLSHGRNYAEDRESPLTNITPENIDQLGLTWSFDTNTSRGLEASPLVIDGIIYSTSSWSKAFALNAVTGELVWEYDPMVAKIWGANACCDVVNRGVAAWGDTIFLGTLDGRLIALDKTNGTVKWETLTIDTTRPYTITGAPRVVNGKVLIGNGGAEFGVRGYLSAYDAESGKLIWRFYTVPGDPKKPYESAAMRMAAKTWTGDVYWKVGGGGTVWDSMAYDSDLNLLYFGVGNGSPWNRHIRSPEGGDNLFLSSIVAVNPDTGEYVWHYQTTPAESWDYTATQHIILADLVIDNEKRKVLMQAPKNGFFYVLDRSDGKLLSAEKYIPANWASHVDLTTGRPVETDAANHKEEAKMTIPGPFGGHNWHPMAFNQKEGLVYIPALVNSYIYDTPEIFKYLPGPFWNTGNKDVREQTDLMDQLPPKLVKQLAKKMFNGRLVAWDPIEQKERWSVDHPTMWNGGVLTTSSGLVFQGTGDGRLVAYNANSGENLWETETMTGVVAPPISYQIDGVQYLAVMAGWGGTAALLNLPESKTAKNGRLLVYTLGGKATLSAAPDKPKQQQPPARRGTEDSIKKGSALFFEYCAICHGSMFNTENILTDLRDINEGSHIAFKQIVLDGIFQPKGMKSFKGVLNEEEVDNIHDYIIDAANLKWEQEHSEDNWWDRFVDWIYELLAKIIFWIMM
ncbi:MAG: quinohemoprotein ethanol dehydrogenase [Gammaproteobacteria bacterium]|jgi:quinohemoprotein ethanol dehydrogenase